MAFFERLSITSVGQFMMKQIQIVALLSLISLCIGCKEKKDVALLRKVAFENEVSFKHLVDDFTSSLPDSIYLITFGVGNSSSVNLTYYRNQGDIADRKNYFGGNDLDLHSTELDNALKDLGWTYETITNLTRGLNAIQSDYIRNTDWFGKPINVYNSPEGFINSDYNIYPVEMLDTVKAVHGAGIEKSDFLRRVYIMTSSAL